MHVGVRGVYEVFFLLLLFHYSFVAFNNNNALDFVHFLSCLVDIAIAAAVDTLIVLAVIVIGAAVAAAAAAQPPQSMMFIFFLHLGSKY